MKKLLLVNGNPDAATDRLTNGLADAYQEGAEAAGHSVSRINVGALAFSMLRTAAEFGTTPSEQAIVHARSAFLAADHVAFLYPLWLGGPPALLKGFLEQVARNQFFILENKGGFPRGALTGRSASVIVTMGMPSLLYRTLFGAHGTKAFDRSILRMAGFSPVRTHLFGGRAITAPHTTALIEKVRRMRRKLA